MMSKRDLEDSRDEIYKSLSEHLSASLDKRVGKKLAKEIFELSFKLAFTKASEHGYLRLPGGLGTIKKVERNSINIHTPYGEIVEVPRRFKLKFSCGIFQKKILSDEDKVE